MKLVMKKPMQGYKKWNSQPWAEVPSQINDPCLRVDERVIDGWRECENLEKFNLLIWKLYSHWMVLSYYK